LGHDIIGDIHGQADKLDGLLRKLGYQNTSGAWRHPDRRAVFVGDFVDRGLAQVRTVDTVRRMVDAGTGLAVMGNHELNAIAWHTPHPGQSGEYLRQRFSPERGKMNRAQHAAFLAEVEDQPGLHGEIIDWFLTLPLWLDLQEFQVVHACWHEPFIKWLAPLLKEGRCLSRELMVQATQEPGDLTERDNAVPSVFKAVEALTKGIEIPLPEGHFFMDKDGHKRQRVRVKWWDEQATTYRAAAMLSPAESSAFPDTPIPEHARISLKEKPVFFAHYWLTGMPTIQTRRSACLDYSAGKGGPLVAYCFDGESELSSEKFAFFD